MPILPDKSVAIAAIINESKTAGPEYLVITTPLRT